MDITRVIAAFQEAMFRSGIIPPGEIIPDGQIHRFSVSKRAGDTAGWYVLHEDVQPHGAFGSWRAGLNVRWVYGVERLVGTRQHLERQSLALLKVVNAEQQRAHEEAARRAEAIWSDCLPARLDHPYLLRKGVRPFGARQLGPRLVLPVRDLDGTLYSLQYIGEHGEKRLLKGGVKRGLVIPVNGRLSIPSQVLICEGWATGATLAEEKPMALVLAAIDAGNLHMVTQKARRAWPDAEITVCADADNVGQMKGRAAAIAGSALLAIPHFPPGVEGSDFNDLKRHMQGGR